MTDGLDEEQLAARLRAAESSRLGITPVRMSTVDASVTSAYRIQSINTGIRVDAGERIVGRKIGLTSAAVQRQLGVDQPDFGVLFDTMQVPDGGTLSIRELLSPRIEAEIAFILKDDLAGPALTLTEVRAAVECVLPCLEIVDSRIAGWDIGIFDTVADNGSASRFVTGSTRRPLDGFDCVNCLMEMRSGDSVVATGRGSASLGDPLNALWWLANKALELDRPLRAGEIILSGALGPMAPVLPGRAYTAAIEGLGTVTVRFEL